MARVVPMFMALPTALPMTVCGRWMLQGEAVPLCRGEHLVLLRIVEVLDVEPALLLPERRLRERALAIGLEGAEVVLETCDQRNMPDRAGGTQPIQKVAHHGGIDADVLGFRRLPGPGRDEHGLRLDLGKGCGERGLVLEVGRNRPYSRLRGRSSG